MIDPTGFDYWSRAAGQGVYIIRITPIGAGPKELRNTRMAYPRTSSRSVDQLAQNATRTSRFTVCHSRAASTLDPGAALQDRTRASRFRTETLYDDFKGRSKQVANIRCASARLHRRDLQTIGMMDNRLACLGVSGISKRTCVRRRPSMRTSAGCWLSRSGGLAEDTIIIYTSDQGFFSASTGFSTKRLMYELSGAGRRSIIHWPGHTKAVGQH